MQIEIEPEGRVFSIRVESVSDDCKVGMRVGGQSQRWAGQLGPEAGADVESPDGVAWGARGVDAAVDNEAAIGVQGGGFGDVEAWLEIGFGEKVLACGAELGIGVVLTDFC